MRGPVAQLVRAPSLYLGGRRFESSPAHRRMSLKKEDKLVSNLSSPLAKEWRMGGDFKDEVNAGVSVEGDLEIGRKGHPVTVTIEDEVSGEVLEVNHVESAFLVIEDRRRNTSGWLAIAIGEVKTLGKVLGFLAGATLDNLKEMVKKQD